MARARRPEGGWTFWGSVRERRSDTLGPRFRWWHRVICVLVILPFAVVFGEGQAFAQKISRRRAIVTRAERIAARMHIDPQLILNPKAYIASRARAAEVKREAEVRKMRARLGPDPKKVRALHAEVARIRALHPNAPLQALARVLDVVHRDAKRAAAGGKPVPRELVHAARQLLTEARGRVHGRHAASLRYKLSLASSALRRIDVPHVSRETFRQAARRLDPKAQVPHVGTAPAHGFLRALPRLTPRRLLKHTELSPSLRQLYADVGDQAWVEGDDGTMPAGAVAVAGTDALSAIDADATNGRIPGVRVAMAGGPFPVFSGLPAFALGVPTAADLAPTADAPLTPEIQALATKLDHDPLKIFNYVHDTFRTELYYGASKGAVGVLAEGGGNDFDQASLLMALLRASGIPARYEYATVRLTPAQVLAMTGFETIGAATDALATVGVPGSVQMGQVTQNGHTVDAPIFVHMERAFVRAYVPYGNYRGTGPGTGRHIWVRLDPALKTMRAARTANLRGLYDLDTQAYLSQVQADSPEEAWEQGLLAAAKQQNVCTTLESGLWDPKPVAAHLDLLPADHPGKVESSLMVFDQVPTALSWRVALSAGGHSTSVSMTALYAKPLEVSFPGATAADRAAIGDDVTRVTPYLVNVVPTITENGQTLLAGNAVIPGTVVTVGVTLDAPRVGTATFTHDVTAGGVFGLRIATGAPPESGIAAAEKALRAAPASAGRDAHDLAVSDLVLEHYVVDVAKAAKRILGLERFARGDDFTEALSGRPVSAQYLSGLPISLARRNEYTVDVGRESSPPLPVDGDATRKVALNELVGLEGSYLEHHGFEQVLNGAAVSAVKTIEVANAQGVPVLTIDQSNAASQIALLTGYDPASVTEIQNAVAAGRVATVPARTVDYDGFSGIEGYILLDAATGAGLYRLGASLNGGKGTTGSKAATGSACQCGGTGHPGPSRFRFSDGDMTETRTDVSLPAVGIPIVLTRTYRSRSPSGTAFGTKWGFSYGERIDANPDGSLTYLTGSLQALTFTSSGASTWSGPPGWHQVVTQDASGYAMRFKDGMVHRFDATGRLVEEDDPNGNAVTLQYDAAGRLATVTDASGRVALTFAYSAAGLVDSVTDAAGRTVGYAYTGTDLTSATDVLGHAESYAYDAKHLMTAHTDRIGSTVTELYDEDGWYLGWIDALGDRGQVVYDTLARKAVYVDPLGNATEYVWNALGNPVRVTDPLGEVTTSTWDGDRNRTATTDARGNTTSYTYDAEGNRLSMTDALNETTRYTYDPTFNRLKVTTNPDGTQTVNHYDANGNLTSSRDALYKTTTYTYYANGQLHTIAQPGGATTTLGYNGTGNVNAMTDPTGGTTGLGYDGAGHLTSMKDADGNARSMVVDAAGEVTSMTDAMGHTSSFTYDGEGHRLTATDPTGATTSFGYDALGRLVRTEDAAGHVTQTEYDADGRVVATVDARGARTEMTYDALGRLVTVTTADGGVTTQGYCADLSSSPCQTVDPMGRVTTATFDALGRETTTSDALGDTTTTTFDTLGRRHTQTGPNGHQTKYTYDADGRLHTVTDPMGFTTTYTYDDRGNRTGVTDALGHTTSFTYDLASRLETETTPIGTTTTYTYDPAGNRATRVDASNRTTSYHYDPNRRLLDKDLPGGVVHSFKYDSRGNRTYEADPAVARTRIYDTLSRLKAVTDHALQKTIDYQYDENGNRTKLTWDSKAIAYRYDQMNRLVEVTDPDGGHAHLGYDLSGRRTSLRFANGILATYSYDGAGRLTDIVYTKPDGTVVESFHYELDHAGNRLTKGFADGTREVYVYDADDRLTDVTYGDGHKVTYNLDAVGNRQALRELNPNGTVARDETYRYNAFNQLTTRHISTGYPNATNETYGYDPQGAMTSKVAQITTSAGTTTETTTYTYNTNERLSQITLADGSQEQFAYDPDGLRTRKNDSAGTTDYLLDGPSVLAEYDAAMSVKALHTNNPQRIDEQFGLTQGHTRLWPIVDAVGSVYAWADARADVADSYSYDAYGTRTRLAGTDDIVWGYTGRQQDRDTSLNYNRDRYLDTSLGKWRSRDALGMIDGPNKYQYVLSDPIGRLDPRGRRVDRPLLASPGAPYGMDKHGKVTYEAKLHFAFNVAAFGTEIGYRLYLHIDLSEVRFTVQLFHLPKGVFEQVQPPTGPGSGCVATPGDWWFGDVDVEDFPLYNAYLHKDYGLGPYSVPEIIVHLFSHFADVVNGWYGTDRREEELRAYMYQDIARTELGESHQDVNKMLRVELGT